MSQEQGADLLRDAKKVLPKETVQNVDVENKERVSQEEPAQRPSTQAGRSVLVLRN